MYTVCMIRVRLPGQETRTCLPDEIFYSFFVGWSTTNPELEKGAMEAWMSRLLGCLPAFLECSMFLATTRLTEL